MLAPRSTYFRYFFVPQWKFIFAAAIHFPIAVAGKTIDNTWVKLLAEQVAQFAKEAALLAYGTAVP